MVLFTVANQRPRIVDAAAYLALGSKPALLVCWAQWVLLLMFAFPRPRWSVRSMNVPFTDDREFPMMDTPTMAPASPEAVQVPPTTVPPGAAPTAVSDLSPLPPAVATATRGEQTEGATTHESGTQGGDGQGATVSASSAARRSPPRTVFGAAAPARAPATGTGAALPGPGRVQDTARGGTVFDRHRRSASVDEGLDLDDVASDSSDDSSLPPRLATRSLSMPAFPVAGGATQPPPMARVRASSCFSEPVTQPPPHHVRALRTSLMCLSAVATCRLVQDALWWTRLVPADNFVFFG